MKNSFVWDIRGGISCSSYVKLCIFVLVTESNQATGMLPLSTQSQRFHSVNGALNALFITGYEPSMTSGNHLTMNLLESQEDDDDETGRGKIL